jgi:hypothetical protein
MSTPGGLGLGFRQVIRPKIFVGYHHRGDQTYYDHFSTAFHDSYEAIYDNSLERKIDSDDAEYIMRQIREKYVTGSSCTIVLVGKETYQRKFVDWEIKATLDKQHGLIGVQLPTAPRDASGLITVPSRLHDNISSGFALWVHWEHITSSVGQLQQSVAAARARSSALILNTRDRRTQNG